MKYGGNAFAELAAGPDPVLTELAALHAHGTRVVLVHGGGPQIDASLARHGITSTRIEGLRITDAATLDVTEAVLCGTINKALVRACSALGIPAVGVSGEDGALLVAGFARAPSGGDLGYVGEVVETNADLLVHLLGASWMPVVAPLAVSPDRTHALNVNADLAAAAIAAALRADAFVAVTNVERIRRVPGDPSTGIDAMTLDEAAAFHATDACAAGMKPKLAAAIAAVRGGCRAAYVCAARGGAIADAIERGTATRIACESAA